MNLRRLAPLALLLAACPNALAQAQAPTATIVVSAGRDLGRVNPLIFGHNIEAGDGHGIYGPSHSLNATQTGDGFWNPQTKAPVPRAVQASREVGMKLLRYPGGCLVHNFDWKKAVGPIATRPDYAFGVDEYLQLCASIGATPLMNVSDYAATPDDAAQLVEYLNAPADAAHPWAQKRAAWGHRLPYAVKYFEMGNETDHGNHDLKPSRRWTATEYADWFNRCAAKMRAVDAKVSLGALTGTGTGPDDPWNETVLKATRGQADFIIVHTYAVGVWAPEAPVGGFAAAAQTLPSGDKLMRASMAAVDQTAAMLGRYRAKIKQYAGRDLPLAITEYNTGFVQEKPVPYRFSFGAALFSADYLRTLLQPQSHVLMANYWHFLNGYWGALQGPKPIFAVDRAWQPQPAFYLFRLWGQHFGSRLVETQVNAPRVEFEGFAGHVLPARGTKYQPEQIATTNLLDGKPLSGTTGNGYITAVSAAQTLRADLRELKGESYPALATLRTNGYRSEAQHYVLSFEARATGDWKGTRLGLGLIDARGWDATKSGIGVEGIEGATDWQRFEGRFDALPDAGGVLLNWRFRGGEQPVSGTLEVRNLRLVTRTPEQFPAYAALTAAASRSADGRKLFLIVFNKHHSEAISTRIAVRDFGGRRARRWTVTGPSLDATNQTTEQVRETESAVAMPLQNSAINYRFPPRSMTAIEIDSGR